MWIFSSITLLNLEYIGSYIKNERENVFPFSLKKKKKKTFHKFNKAGLLFISRMEPLQFIFQFFPCLPRSPQNSFSKLLDIPVPALKFYDGTISIQSISYFLPFCLYIYFDKLRSYPSNIRYSLNFSRFIWLLKKIYFEFLRSPFSASGFSFTPTLNSS